MPDDTQDQALNPVRAVMAVVSREASALFALAIGAGAALAFIDIAEDSAEPNGRSFDLAVLHWLHPGPDLTRPIGPAWLAQVMHDLTSLGSLSVLGVVALIAIGYLLLQRQVKEALGLLAAVGGGLGLSETLKRVFERSRPPQAYHAIEALNASFPSGHALMSTVFYLTLGAMLARAAQSRALKSYVLGVAIALALVVGLSRVYLGVHWASDVLAGWSLGAAWAMACWLAGWALKRWRRPVQVPAERK